MTHGLQLTELQAMSLDQLESLWAEPVPLSPPRGVYRGHVLRRIDHATSRRALWRWSERAGFVYTPFGIDFDQGRWFFFTPRLAIGHFEARPGSSRWRDTNAIGLHYQGSRLPRPLRRVLYDEVKPLTDRSWLGIGGINRDHEGDHFFFALDRLRGR